MVTIMSFSHGYRSKLLHNMKRIIQNASERVETICKLIINLDVWKLTTITLLIY